MQKTWYFNPKRVMCRVLFVVARNPILGSVTYLLFCSDRSDGRSIGRRCATAYTAEHDECDAAFTCSPPPPKRISAIFVTFFTPSKGYSARVISTTQLYLQVKGFYLIFLTLLWKPVARVGCFLRNFNRDHVSIHNNNNNVLNDTRKARSPVTTILRWGYRENNLMRTMRVNTTHIIHRCFHNSDVSFEIQ